MSNRLVLDPYYSVTTHSVTLGSAHFSTDFVSPCIHCAYRLDESIYVYTYIYISFLFLEHSSAVSPSKAAVLVLTWLFTLFTLSFYLSALADTFLHHSDVDSTINEAK